MLYLPFQLKSLESCLRVTSDSALARLVIDLESDKKVKRTKLPHIRCKPFIISKINLQICVLYQITEEVASCLICGSIPAILTLLLVLDICLPTNHEEWIWECSYWATQWCEKMEAIYLVHTFKLICVDNQMLLVCPVSILGSSLLTYTWDNQLIATSRLLQIDTIPRHYFRPPKEYYHPFKYVLRRGYWVNNNVRLPGRPARKSSFQRWIYTIEPGYSKRKALLIFIWSSGTFSRLVALAFHTSKELKHPGWTSSLISPAKGSFDRLSKQWTENNTRPYSERAKPIEDGYVWIGILTQHDRKRIIRHYVLLQVVGVRLHI